MAILGSDSLTKGKLCCSFMCQCSTFILSLAMAEARRFSADTEK